MTQQELRVVQLAAVGLSNREIGDRIHLSHRTVGYHLHKAFTKLGVTRRTQLCRLVCALSGSAARRHGCHSRRSGREGDD
nr:LuxR C-terminal-related transcriptional regulator [Actinophytocola oryzae]